MSKINTVYRKVKNFKRYTSQIKIEGEWLRQMAEPGTKYSLEKSASNELTIKFIKENELDKTIY
jgi:hypothetical protein